MNFDDSEIESSYRKGVRKFLDQNAKRLADPDDMASHTVFLDADAGISAARQWQHCKANAGYAGISWPTTYGGQDGTAIQEVIYEQEERGYDVPRGFFDIGLGMCIPTLMQWASEDIKLRYVKPALQGEEIWCQLFSEPEAGSDVAAITSRAVRDGDNWIISGQKVWTSGAQFADFGLVLVRTDPSQPKHGGLTMFFLDMRSPGIDIRPIRQATGYPEFNEVFFDKVQVPDSQRLGDINKGWSVAVSTLMHERNSLGGGIGFITPRQLWRQIENLDLDESEKHVAQNRIIDWQLTSRALELINLRAMSSISQGQYPGPEQSIHKLVYAKQAQAMAEFMFEYNHEQAILLEDHHGAKWKQVLFSWYWGAAFRIAGGSDEILKNTIAERVLNLPPEPRIDKDISFTELRAKLARK